jgi:hypothetical protein
MIYRGPSILAVVWFGSYPTPSPRQRLVSISPSSCVVAGRTYWRESGGGGGLGRSQIRWWRESLVLYKSFIRFESSYPKQILFCAMRQSTGKPVFSGSLGRVTWIFVTKNMKHPWKRKSWKKYKTLYCMAVWVETHISVESGFAQ